MNPKDDVRPIANTGPRSKSGEIELAYPQDLLKDCIIFFAFPKSRSANLPIAIRLAKTATAYGEQDVDGRILHWAAFKNSVRDLERAAELMRLAGSWVGSIARIRGQRVANPYNTHATISCYLNGLQCSSQTAHCHKVIDDPFHPNFDRFAHRVSPASVNLWELSTVVETTEEVSQYSFPCKRMLETSYLHPQFRFAQVQPSRMPALIQAAAVEYGISICPFFDASSFKVVGVRPMKVYASISPKANRRKGKASKAKSVKHS